MKRSTDSIFTRRQFLKGSAAFAGAGALNPLFAAMKYDREAVLDLFRLRAADIDTRVKAGVEANRKGSFRFDFVGADGKPCERVHVKLTQAAHDFKYGADLFMLDEIPDSPVKNAAYKDRFAAAFNLATLPFYWKDLEPEEGRHRYAADSKKIYRRPPPDLCLDWCAQHGIEPKAHCLNYSQWAPEWAKGDVAFEKAKLVKRFRELAERYAAKIPMWEVTNETFFQDYWKDSFYRAPDFVEWSFKEAEKHFPANHLVINEAHCRIWDDTWFRQNRSPYFMQIERALLKGARIDAVGLQFHMFFKAAAAVKETRAFYDPERLFDVLDTYAALGKPLQITEITIPAYSNDSGDEAVQAEILRELYRIWFAHPAMEAIIYWNLPDGYAAFAEPGDCSSGENAYYGGLCRFDMTPKPAYDVVRDLFGREWRTKVDAEASGRFVFRGFYGTYDAEFTANGKTVTRKINLSKDGVRSQVIKFT